MAATTWIILGVLILILMEHSLTQNLLKSIAMAVGLNPYFNGTLSDGTFSHLALQEQSS